MKLIGLGGLRSIFFTHYAISICSKLNQLCLKLCPNLPIMLKLCLLFLEGANFYVRISILHCTEKVNINRMAVHRPLNCNIMENIHSPSDSAIADHCSGPYFTAYIPTGHTSRSRTGTWSEDKTTSLPQRHHVPIIPT